MYNERQKNAFLDQYTTSESTRRTSVSAFNAFAPYEEALGADICTLSAQELQPIIDTTSKVRLHTARNRINVLKHYAKWCLANGIPGACDAIMSVRVGDTKESIDSFRSNSVSSPKQLMQNLNKIFESERLETTDSALKCACWLVYGGVLWRWVADVTTDEVDLENMEVVHNGTPSVIYREALPSVRNCATLKQFLYKNAHYGPDVMCYRDRVDGNQLIRGIRGTMTFQYVADKISKKSLAAKKLDESVRVLSLTQIWLCGVFYRTYELEIEGVEPSFTGVARYLYEVDYLADEGRAPLAPDDERRFLRDKARRLMNDYNRWKETF